MRVTVSGHGGAERYWRSRSGARLVLCRDGVFLWARDGRSGWQVAPGYALADLEQHADWQTDSGPAIRGAVSRTNRLARRET